MNKPLKRFLVYDKKSECGYIIQAKTRTGLQKSLRKNVKILGEIK